MSYPNIFCNILEVKEPNERKEEILCALFSNAILRSVEKDSPSKVYQSPHLLNLAKQRLNQGVDHNGRNWFRYLFFYSYDRKSSVQWVDTLRVKFFKSFPVEAKNIINDSGYLSWNPQDFLNLEDGKRSAVISLFKQSFSYLLSDFDSLGLSIFNNFNILDSKFWQSKHHSEDDAFIFNFLNSLISEFDDLFFLILDELQLYQKTRLIKLICVSNKSILTKISWQSFAKDLFVRLLRDFIAFGFFSQYSDCSCEDIYHIYPALTEDTMNSFTVSDFLVRAYEKSLIKETILDYTIVPVLLSALRKHYPQYYNRRFKNLLLDRDGKWFSRSHFYCDIVRNNEFDEALFKNLKKESSEKLWMRVAQEVRIKGDGYLYNNLKFWEAAITKTQSIMNCGEVISITPFEHLPFLLHIKSTAVQNIIQDRLQKLR